MPQRLILFLLFLFIFTGCKEERYALKIPYEGDKLVINAELTPTGITADATHTIPALNGIKYPLTDLQVRNATIHIYENNQLITTLLHTEKGKYKSSVAFVPQKDKNYYLKAYAPNFIDTLISQPIMLVDTPSFVITNYTKYPLSPWGNSCEFGEVKFTLFDRSSQENFYAATIITDSTPNPNNKNVGSCYLFYDNSTICSEIMQFSQYYIGDNYAIDDKCFNNQSIDLVCKSEYYLTPDSAALLVEQYSKDFYKYMQTYIESGLRNVTSAEFLEGNIEPSKAYSNVRGGYGLFYSSASKRYNFKR